MKVWVKPGLETLDVSMTMNNNGLNSVIVSATEDSTNPVESPISEENNSNAEDGISAVENISGEHDVGNLNNINKANEPIESSQYPQNIIVENESEAINDTETEQKTAPTDPLLEEENCIVDETSTESETNGLFAKKEELFNESNQDISEEFQIEGGCSTFLSLGGEEAEEMEKALAALIS